MPECTLVSATPRTLLFNPDSFLELWKLKEEKENKLVFQWSSNSLQVHGPECNVAQMCKYSEQTINRKSIDFESTPAETIRANVRQEVIRVYSSQLIGRGQLVNVMPCLQSSAPCNIVSCWLFAPSGYIRPCTLSNHMHFVVRRKEYHRLWFAVVLTN